MMSNDWNDCVDSGDNHISYISLFSGIEAASVAWEPLGWKPLCFSEIDEFPSAVLAARYPDVPNLGNIKDVDWQDAIGKYGKPDVVIGGSPCQSFSVAGKREGLNGASGLMYEYIRAIQEIRPGILLWENVPGALSSEHGQAFRQLLSSLDDIGYGLAWRVLDSEFWGVAQRRRRVFLVGCLGDPERAAKILFDEQSLYRDPKPSRVKRQEIAERAGNRSQGTDTERDDANAEPANVIALQSDGSTSLGGNGAGWNDTEAAYTLSTLDKQAVAYRMIAINQRNEARYDGGDGQTVGAIPAQPGGKQMQCVIETRRAGGSSQPIPCDSLLSAERAVIMASGQSHAERLVGMSPTLVARQYKDPPILFMPDGTDAGEGGDGQGTRYVVRRLMPIETERLQGFPDAWTDLTGDDCEQIADVLLGGPFSGYDERNATMLRRNVRRWCASCPDSKRYKAVGNSMAVPVIRWLGERIGQYAD